jgi:hypothetical protein
VGGKKGQTKKKDYARSKKNHGGESMKKMVILTGLLIISCFPPMNVSAEIWTDWWWNREESGWGVNVGHQYDTIFAAFFVYGPSGAAKWYSGGAGLTGPTNEYGYQPFSGDLYESTGPFFGSAFNPGLVQRRKVGTFTFSPSSPGTAKVTYSVDGVTSPEKQVERFTINHIPLGGHYLTTGVITKDDCSLLSDTGTPLIIGEFEITETGTPGETGNLTIVFYDDVDSEYCETSATYHQYGSIYSIETATACIIDFPVAMRFLDVKSTAEGISGKVRIEQDECLAEMNFTATRY